MPDCADGADALNEPQRSEGHDVLITHAVRLRELHCPSCADIVVEVLESIADIKYVDAELADDVEKVTCTGGIGAEDLRAWLSDIGFRTEAPEEG